MTYDSWYECIRGCGRRYSIYEVVYRCEDCGKRFWVDHACRNRSCPACHGRQIRQWLASRQAQVLPCPYYHLVATVPACMRPLLLTNQKALYGLFMKTVAQSVLKLLGDPRFLGATPSMLTVLHTWTSELQYHPHVHVLISAGCRFHSTQYFRLHAALASCL